MFVDLDDGGAGDEEAEGEQVQQEVGALTLGFGARGGGGLEDQDCLEDGEDAEGLEEGVRRDKREGWVGEDGGPDYGEEEDGAELGEPGGSCGLSDVVDT
jgi:hypothetical protein